MPTWRAEVDAFFSGPVFARYCGLLGWNRDWAQRRIQRFVAQGERELAGAKPAARNTNLDFRITSTLAS
jgi:hypothetical protein